jgi:hypothetical protein
MHIYSRTVREVLVSDFRLFLIFAAKHPGHDPDIDPTHNPDWRKARVGLELELLHESRMHLERMRQIWQDMPVYYANVD